MLHYLLVWALVGYAGLVRAVQHSPGASSRTPTPALSSALLLAHPSARILGATSALSIQDTMAIYFQEARTATARHKKLWKKDIHGPLLIVDPLTRTAYAPQPDSAGILKPDGKVYSGTLPAGVPIANASQHWSGVHWAMIMLPLIPKDRPARVNLFTHELFHRAQNSLGFVPRDANNGHLDQKEGRLYLRLELVALEHALRTRDKQARMGHIRSALVFRWARFQQYPGADSTENALDINEGIAEYTGMMMSGRPADSLVPHFLRKNQELLAGASFIRTFSYRNIPIYGYLLQQKDRRWNLKINGSTQLTEFFATAFRIMPSQNAEAEAARVQLQYGGQKILLEEDARETEIRERTAKYKALLVDGPHFVIPFQRKKVSFDTRVIFTLGDYGTVYPVMEATDVWGLLKVERVGGLMSPDRSKVTLTAPVSVEGHVVKGEGWMLTLAPGFVVEKDAVTGNWELRAEGL